MVTIMTGATMKNKYTINMKGMFKQLFYLALMIGVVACTKNSPMDNINPDGSRTCKMIFQGDLVNYDNTITKSNEYEWADGSKILLKFNSETGTTTGEATYNAKDKTWSVNYFGSLYKDMPQSCSAVYVQDADTLDGSIVRMLPTSAVFEDTLGQYTFKDGDLIVTANLTPKTGRVRFQGKEGQVLKVFGLTSYYTYDNNTTSYTTMSEVKKVTVRSDGYTPYIYAFFTDKSDCSMQVWVDGKEGYTRYFSDQVLKAGESGKLSVPSENSHNAWEAGLVFKVNEVYFKMIPVEGGTFVMGNPESSDDYYTAHNVTLSSYCISETEITERMAEWSSVDRPCLTTGSSMKAKVDEISKKLNVKFLMPTEAQWEFAARGGNKSKGYVYSGSNNKDEVSASSGSLVKTKLPNELGIYDMSGDYEWVRDSYDKFTSVNVVDPIVITNSEYKIVRNGLPIYARSSSKYNEYSYKSSSRLVINWND